MTTTGCSDKMFVSGVLATIAALAVIILVDDDPVRVMQRLQDVGVIAAVPLEVRRWSIPVSSAIGRGFALVLFLVAMRGFDNLFSDTRCADRVVTWPFIVAYTFTGVRFGRIVSNGVIWHRMSARLNLYVRHPDGTGGIAFVGTICCGRHQPC